MNVTLPTSRVAAVSAGVGGDDLGRLRRLQSLLALLSLYAAALLVVIAFSDGADIGCILGGIAGHVLYATHRMAVSFRDDAIIEDALFRRQRR